MQVSSCICLIAFDFSGNVGGTMGLCFGASLLTLCEFIDLVICAVIKKLKARKCRATVEKM